MSSDLLKPDALSNPLFDDGCESDQQLQTDVDGAMSSQYSTSPSSTLRYSHRSCSPVASDKGSDARLTPDHTHHLTELELLHQECQEKEVIINNLSEQLADWEELQSQLQEKDQFNRQCMEALQAAESTIAYLTACSLDSQGQHESHSSGPDSVASDTTLYRRCTQLQKVLQEKERLNSNLAELLNMSEKFISSSVSHKNDPEISDLCFKIDMALQQVKTSSDIHDLNCDFGATGNLRTKDIIHHTGSQENVLWKQCRPLTGVQDKHRAEDASTHHCHYNTGECNIKSLRQIAAESLKENEAKKNQLELRDSDYINPKMTGPVVKCLSAIESAVASLAEHCTDISALTSSKTSQTSSDLQMNLDNLQKALQESNDLSETTQFSVLCRTKGHNELHNNLCHLYKVFIDKCQMISELQASLQEQKCEDHLQQRTVTEVKGLPPSVKSELETLHKALREKKKTCKSLEERLATALTNPPIPENAQKGTFFGL